MNPDMKSDVKNYWENKVCGAVYGFTDGKQSSEGQPSVDLDKMAQARYRLETFILPFADFPSAHGKRVLEIGVGGGVDFSGWVRHGAHATGIDLTQAGVEMTRNRLDMLGVARDAYQLAVGDAENIAFPEATFDLVYSYGVLHHSPDTQKALQEVCRVLRPGGDFKGMIYHVPSWVGWMLWTRYALLTGRPWKSPRRAIFEHLESPGTKAYTCREATRMLRTAGFRETRVWTKLGIGDLLLNTPRKKYQSPIERFIRRVYPRWFIRLLGDRWGMGMFLHAVK